VGHEISVVFCVVVGVGMFVLGTLIQAEWGAFEKRGLKAENEALRSSNGYLAHHARIALCKLSIIKNAVANVDAASIPVTFRTSNHEVLMTLEEIGRQAELELLKAKCDVGCFATLEGAHRWFLQHKTTEEKHGNSIVGDPVFVKLKAWDGDCWHVIYQTDDLEQADDAMFGDVPDASFDLMGQMNRGITIPGDDWESSIRAGVEGFTLVEMELKDASLSE